MSNFEILKRLYKTYTKKFRYKILLSIFFSLIVAGSTASIAWLLDPAIKKLFIDKFLSNRQFFSNKQLLITRKNSPYS